LNNIQLNDRRFGFFFVAPAVVILSIVILAPIVIAIITSFYDYTLINRSLDNFIGLNNYFESIANKKFLHSTLVTITFVFFVVLFEFLIGFLIAILLNQVERFRNVYYFILLIPLLINPVVVGLIWRMFLHPQLGILNYLIGFIGIEPVNWLGDPQNAFITIIFVDIWHQVSFMIILLLAGLASIPEEPYEAARVDGANAFQQFRDITLPYMRPVIIITLLIRLIFALKTYDLIYIMTKGGPGDATDLISYYIYRSAFIGLDLGQAASMSVILLFIVCIIIYPLFKYMSRADE
jgi:multiple sugar transport system permease protein|tara:strand:- start:137 stop:1015 length:879 start_codon:yes stop_codon:yes gene_type:complete